MIRIKTMFIAILATFNYMTINAQNTVPSQISNADIVLHNISTRTSIRKFQNKPVEADVIEKLLRAGMAAPTANDNRPWHFVVLKDSESIEKYAASNKFHADDIKATPLFIFVCGDTTRMESGQARDFWIEDVSAASENILLAAHALGLGAVWTSIYPIQKKVIGISKALKLPGNLIPLNAICIGYPAEKPEPKDKWNENYITYGIPK